MFNHTKIFVLLASLFILTSCFSPTSGGKKGKDDSLVELILPTISLEEPDYPFINVNTRQQLWSGY